MVIHKPTDRQSSRELIIVHGSPLLMLSDSKFLLLLGDTVGLAPFTALNKDICWWSGGEITQQQRRGCLFIYWNPHRCYLTLLKFIGSIVCAIKLQYIALEIVSRCNVIFKNEKIISSWQWHAKQAGIHRTLLFGKHQGTTESNTDAGYSLTFITDTLWISWAHFASSISYYQVCLRKKSRNTTFPDSVS